MSQVIGYDFLYGADLKYFKSLQTIGNQKLFDKYNNIKSIIDKSFDEKYRNFLAYPVIEDNRVEFHGIQTKENFSSKFIDLTGDDRDKYENIFSETLDIYNNVITKLQSDGKNTEAEFIRGAIKFVDKRFIVCYDDIVVLCAWGMQLRDNVNEGYGEIRVQYSVDHLVKFNVGDLGTINGKSKFVKRKGKLIFDQEIPVVNPIDGYEFIGWNQNPSNYLVNEDVEFVAQYEKIHIEDQPVGSSDSIIDDPEENKQCLIRFVSNDFGNVIGQKDFLKNPGDVFRKDEIPRVETIEGYKFNGWTEDPISHYVTSDKVFTASYNKIETSSAPPLTPTIKLPWWKRFWLWLTALFTAKGCLTWLLRALLLLLLFMLLIWLLRSCDSCSRHSSNGGAALRDNDNRWLRDDPNVGDGGGIYDPNNPYNPTPTPPGNDEILPPQQGVLPPVTGIPEETPGNPIVLNNRLNILMENEDKSILDLAKAFKEKYPGEKYKVVYYDDVVKRMQIELPPEERDKLKTEIPAIFSPDYELFVFDESLFGVQELPNDPGLRDNDKSWYLKEISAFKAWEITRGSEDITVAIVDNGFNLDHPELKSKVIQPYNVWKHSDYIFPQEVDHGTHVAGTALALADNSIGICGIAPNCKFMPVPSSK